MGFINYMIVIAILVSGVAGCEEKEKEEAINTAPVINSFQADPVSVNPGGQINLVVSATDVEGKALTYTYQTDGGSITGTGDKVTWTAPETAGSYVISVDVSDGELSVQSTVNVTVVAPPPEAKRIELKIQWFGQSCFLITSTDGKRVLTDPFGPGVGYPVPSVEADVVLVSHSHSDHNNVSMAKGKPEVFMAIGSRDAAGISFLGIQSDHDDAGGAKRGKNIIFVWEMDGMRLAHLGDFGQLSLTDSQLSEIGKVDILFIPIGGTYTIDAGQAAKIIEQLSPKLIFPMHYRTDIFKSLASGIDDFTAGKDNVERVDGNSIVVEKLPDKTKIIVLNYK